MRKRLNIVVTGEVDSGKSTLIGRLLYEIGSLPKNIIDDIEILAKNFEFAYLLDSLKEERDGKLTIDTTQAFCTTRKGREFVFIDVPGHKELLKNMLSGTSYADIAIFVIDLENPAKEQVKKHALILSFLGIKDIICVFNKIDTINFNENIFNKMKENIARFFIDNISINPKYCIPISAKYGDGLLTKTKTMPWYKGIPLIKAISIHSQKRGSGSFCFPIQDIYNICGTRIAAGKIISGGIRKGQKVFILPSNAEKKVEEIKVFNRNKYSAKVPENVGLVLNNMDSLSRGQVICRTELPKVTNEFRAKIFCISPINIRENLIFKCLTQQSTCQIQQIDRAWDLENLEFHEKQDRLSENIFSEVLVSSVDSVVIERFEQKNSLGRFILMKNNEIHAIGIVL